MPKSLKAEAGHFRITSQVFGRPPVDHPIYAQIGRIASEWSHVENLLDAIICELASLPARQGACITGQMMGYAPRLNAIIGLLIDRNVDRKLVDKAHSLMDSLRGVAEERNRFIHDAWYIEINENKPYQKRGVTRNDVRKTKPSVPYKLRYGLHDTGGIEHAKATFKAIQKSFDDVSLFLHAIRVELRALRDK
jgi:hypothetical protein